MGKKKEDVEVLEHEGEVLADYAEAVSAIEPLTIDFGREDLNLMRDKINEIIIRR